MILSGIFSSLTKDILVHAMFMKTSRQAWMALENMFASRTRLCVVQIRMQLINLKKRDLLAIDYFKQMKNLANTLSSVGMPPREHEIVS